MARTFLSKKEAQDYGDAISAAVLEKGPTLLQGEAYSWERKPTNIMLVFDLRDNSVIAWSAMFADKRIVYRIPPADMQISTTPREFVPVEHHINNFERVKRCYMQRDYEDGWVLLQ